MVLELCQHFAVDCGRYATTTKALSRSGFVTVPSERVTQCRTRLASRTSTHGKNDVSLCGALSVADPNECCNQRELRTPSRFPLQPPEQMRVRPPTEHVGLTFRGHPVRRNAYRLASDRSPAAEGCRTCAARSSAVERSSAESMFCVLGRCVLG